MLADAIVHWTARLFVACYIGRLCIDASALQDGRSLRVARWLWTCGCLVFFIHVAAAFHFLHGWSHASAYEHVLLRTKEMTGFLSGVGLYVNYAFGILWVVDTVLWWRDLNWPNRKIPYYCVQAAFAFLVFQATAVFGPSFWWPVSLAVIVMLIVLRRFAAMRSSRAQVDQA